MMHEIVEIGSGIVVGIVGLQLPGHTKRMLEKHHGDIRDKRGHDSRIAMLENLGLGIAGLHRLRMLLPGRYRPGRRA